MIIPAAILLLTCLLFFVWFRYTCNLILSTRTSKDYSEPVAAANRLNYLKVQTALSSKLEADHLDELKESLHRDYVMVTYLLNNATDVELGDHILERKLLKLDYQLLSLYYSIVRRIFAIRATGALREMTHIVAHFANAMGEQTIAKA